MTKIKICGITRLDDALAACHTGADALGFNFCQTTPRQILPEQAKAIIENLPPFIQATGIFVEQPVDEIIAICRHCHIQIAQLHSDQYSPEMARTISESVKVIKVFRPQEDFQVELVREFTRKSGINTFLFDAYRPDVAGGTGEIISKSLAVRIFGALDTSCYGILAGGLNHLNVAAAIRSIHPYGVDTASGVESAPGIKDTKKMTAFINAVWEAGS